MTRTAALAAGALFFLIVGTANAGGYRFGVSDQAFYVPAIALAADDSLFPRDRAVFEPQMRFWLGDEALGALVRHTQVPLPVLFGLLHVVTMIALAAGASCLARRLGLDWWTIAVAIVLMTLRHRIARTGANSLEGYMHPRMLAFALGLVALAYVVRLRPMVAALWTMAAAVVHSSTAIWFAGVVLIAAIWPHARSTRARAALGAGGVAALVAAAFVAGRMPVMDPAWLAVLGDRDYLFSLHWPFYAWAGNLAYPVVILLIYRRRAGLRATVAGEAGLVAGLLALVAVFFVSLPFAERHTAFVVQLQANRVFWLLDAVVAIYLAWWIVGDLARRAPVRRRALIVAALALLAAGRGVFVLHEAGRPLAQPALPDNDWTAAMRWLRQQPTSWHVLADPAHAWKYGTSVRVAARRDTPLELGKDPAMAMYDRALAARVAERTEALAGFDDWTTEVEVRSVATRYDLDVFVDRTDRHFDLPALFRNDRFVVYDLRSR